VGTGNGKPIDYRAHDPINKRSHAHYLKGAGPIFVYDSLCPLHVAANRRADVAEYITRVNGGLRIGAFELDWDEGECRFAPQSICRASR